MNANFKKFKQKDDESGGEFERVHQKQRYKKSAIFKSFRYWMTICFLLFINYYLFSNYILLNLRNDLLLKNDYWMAMQNQDKKNCLTRSEFNQTTLSTFKELINFLNQKSDFNYFMCFSTLYYTVKVENYDVFSSHIDQNTFGTKNSIYFDKSRDKCVHRDIFSNISQKIAKNKTRLNLCYLKTFLKENSLCDIVRDFELRYKKRILCEYEYMTGEYRVIFNDEIELVFYEYQLELDSFRFFSNSFYSKNKTDFELEFFEENANLRQGWVGILFTNNYFSMPRHFFYSKFYTSRVRSNFINYLGAPVRLPSEIINYFMIFYSSIWYL